MPDLNMERLRYYVEKRIQTTMIGALARVEDNLGFLWGLEIGRAHV